MEYARGTPEIETTTSLDGAPSPWHVQPVSTVRPPLMGLTQGGPFGLATTGARRQIERNRMRSVLDFIMSPLICPLRLLFSTLLHAHGFMTLLWRCLGLSSLLFHRRKASSFCPCRRDHCQHRRSPQIESA